MKPDTDDPSPDPLSGDHDRANDDAYPHFNIDDPVDWPGLVRQVHDGCARAHIGTNDDDHCCVLISRSELEAMEEALAILGESPQVRAMSSNIRELLHAAATPAPPMNLRRRIVG